MYLGACPAGPGAVASFLASGETVKKISAVVDETEYRYRLEVKGGISQEKRREYIAAVTAAPGSHPSFLQYPVRLSV